MKIANGINMLQIEANVLGGVDVIHPVLIFDEETVILIDTGYPGLADRIYAAIELAGVPADRLNKIIITHQDLDHIGSLPALSEKAAGSIEVLASTFEKPYIEGEERLLKLTPEAIAQIESILPANVPEEWKRAFKAVLENPPSSKVHRIIEDGEELPFCGRLNVISTPGHTPGHISLYHKQSKTLIAADALTIVSGQLQGPDRKQTLDMDTAIKSLYKLAQYDIEHIICYHGGLYSGEASKRIAELADELSAADVI
ncbi:MBL fold metallo-hydrolase [Bacillus sp. M6-12]|uniref:MBL fold metallo-hydrolase n=1 Tax=Bacillus sp. M6-12 TaxID=2054166 RepID=UPI000C7698DF|nr:MBL fold metallo-hydrolase [Bacillus sp. M6-12]PLS15444.1 MBL fold metallo-hydrolase [Bacillus sp. M6-12]